MSDIEGTVWQPCQFGNDKRPYEEMEMLFDEVILGRRSIRGYKPDPVPKELIKEIIYLALRAP